MSLIERVKIPISLVGSPAENKTAETIKRLNVWVDKASDTNTVFTPVEAMDVDWGDEVSGNGFPTSGAASLTDRIVTCVIPPLVLDELEERHSDRETRFRLGLVKNTFRDSSSSRSGGEWFETLIMDTLCLRLFRFRHCFGYVLPFLQV